MSILKLIGEIDCYECGRPIQIEENMGVHNFIGKRCSHCDTMNIVNVDINEGKVSKNIKK